MLIKKSSKLKCLWKRLCDCGKRALHEAVILKAPRHLTWSRRLLLRGHCRQDYLPLHLGICKNSLSLEIVTGESLPSERNRKLKAVWSWIEDINELSFNWNDRLLAKFSSVARLLKLLACFSRFFCHPELKAKSKEVLISILKPRQQIRGALHAQSVLAYISLGHFLFSITCTIVDQTASCFLFIDWREKITQSKVLGLLSFDVSHGVSFCARSGLSCFPSYFSLFWFPAVF